jgi:hypothetical protein
LADPYFVYIRRYLYTQYIYWYICFGARATRLFRIFAYNKSNAAAAMASSAASGMAANDPGHDHAKDARALYEKLLGQKRLNRADWWGSFEVVKDETGPTVEVKLRCVRCCAKLSASNASRTAKEHLRSRLCTSAQAAGVAAAASIAAAAAAAAAARAMEPGGDGADSLSSSTSKRARSDTGPMDRFVLTADQVTTATTHLARFFYMSGTALHLIEQEDLVAAFAAVGVCLPKRKVLAGRMLDAEYERVKTGVDKQISSLPMLQLATDGWRRGHCADGVPLINIMVLKPNGSSNFVKVESARGVCKDADWIAEQHLRWAEEVTDGQLDRMLGMVMDNTKVSTASFICTLMQHASVYNHAHIVTSCQKILPAPALDSITLLGTRVHHPEPHFSLRREHPTAGKPEGPIDHEG